MKMHIYRPGSPECETKEVPDGSLWRDVKELVCTSIPCRHAEQVSVLFLGERCDMFVDEDSAQFIDGRGPLPVNEAATQIYYAASLARGLEPETGWPSIHGVAVVFDGRVWY